MPIYVMNGKKSRRRSKRSAKKESTMSSRTQNRRKTRTGGKAKKRRSPKAKSKTSVVVYRPKATHRAKPKSRRRRRNPSMGGLLSGIGPIVADIKSAVPRIAGKLAAIALVKRFGGPSGAIMGPTVTTPSRGESWTLQQYAIAIATGLFAPKIVGKFVNGSEFRKGIVDLIVEKVLWSEVIARSPTAMQWLGAEGDVQYDPSTGQMYVQQGGQYVAMQGYGDLVPQTQYGGLVPATQYGHLLPPNVDDLTARAQWDNSGFVNRFDAAYAAQR